MNEQLVTPEHGVRLKAAGFDWPVFSHEIKGLEKIFPGGCPINWNAHDGVLSIPTLSQAARWLREVKALHVCVDMDNGTNKWGWMVRRTTTAAPLSWSFSDTHDTALSTAIDRALEINSLRV